MVLSPEYFPGAYYQRNRYLVDHSSVCIAYMCYRKSGTGHTVNYAEKMGVPVINIAKKTRTPALGELMAYDSENHSHLLQTLDDFNLRMAQTGAIVIHYRAHFVKRLRERATKACRRGSSSERTSSSSGSACPGPTRTT